MLLLHLPVAGGRDFLHHQGVGNLAAPGGCLGREAPLREVWCFLVPERGSVPPSGVWCFRVPPQGGFPSSNDSSIFPCRGTFSAVASSGAVLAYFPPLAVHLCVCGFYAQGRVCLVSVFQDAWFPFPPVSWKVHSPAGIPHPLHRHLMLFDYSECSSSPRWRTTYVLLGVKQKGFEMRRKTTSDTRKNKKQGKLYTYIISRLVMRGYKFWV